MADDGQVSDSAPDARLQENEQDVEPSDQRAIIGSGDDPDADAAPASDSEATGDDRMDPAVAEQSAEASTATGESATDADQPAEQDQEDLVSEPEPTASETKAESTDREGSETSREADSEDATGIGPEEQRPDAETVGDDSREAAQDDLQPEPGDWTSDPDETVVPKERGRDAAGSGSRDDDSAGGRRAREAEPVVAAGVGVRAAGEGSGESFGSPDRSAMAADESRGTDAAADRPLYPEVRDRSDYLFTDREFAFAEVTPEQVWDMHEHRAPLGVRPEQWDSCVSELRDALAVEGIADADVRLQGSGARFCSENPKKWFPQNEDELRAKVADHYRDASQEERELAVERSVAIYRGAGFAKEGSKPAAPFFDSLYKLDATSEASDYDFQLSSGQLAERFQQLEKADPGTEWRSQHGGHYKHRHLERVAPALHSWALRWENTFGREVTLATFDRHGPESGLDEGDWRVIEPEEETT